MKKFLQISPILSLPLSAVTSTLVVYGGKGQGKTSFGAGTLCEEFAAAGLRFSFIDAMGVAWGLRHSADGKGPGIEVLILGGIHGDMPIEPTAGAVVADLVADEDVSVIIDISRRADGSMWAIAERVRFVRDYCKQLYKRQGAKRRPIMQIIDECARFAPQMIRHGEGDVAACMGAVAVLVEEGRNVGIGVCLLTQRSARLNKDVAELADCMIAFRTIGPNSMDAVLDWLGEHVEKARIKEFAATLRTMPVGTALVVSPGWLGFEGVVPMRMRHTFDSSKTPEAGTREVRASGPGAKPDLARYQVRMAETIERAAQDDPKALKAEIAKLKRELAAKPLPTVTGPVKEIRVEVPMLSETDMRWIDRVSKTIEDSSKMAYATSAELTQASKRIHEIVDLRFKILHAPIAARPRATPIAAKSRAVVPIAARSGSTPATDLGKGERTVLAAIAQHPDGCTREQITVLTGYKKSSRDTYLQRLGARELVEIRTGATFVVTQAGLDALGPDFEPLPTGDALREHWLQKLPEGERKILEVLANAFPNAVDREALSEATSYKKSSRDSYLQRLGARRLIESAGRDGVRASGILFDEGAA